MSYQYPIQLNFKLIALAPRIFVRDASGRSIFYVQQKVMALKEHVKVFSDEQMGTQLYEIKADRMIDFSARYRFRDMSGREVGSIKHRGMRSIWKAHYEISRGSSETEEYHLTEDNAWVKIADSLFNEIPFVSLFTGYVFNPSYTLYRTGSETPLFHLKKQPAFFESAFTIEKADPSLDGDEETALLLALMMAVQLERSRG